MPEFERKKRLGAGAFGEVWLAYDKALGIERAVKYVPKSKVPDPTSFFNEPQTLMELHHPNIVSVEDAGTTNKGGRYIAMEYLPNGSVEDTSKGGIVPIRWAVRLACDVCRAVDYAHNKHVIHRDIKPANILIGPSGEGKLSDFGLATRAVGGTASAYGYVAHLAPEVFKQGVTSDLTDIYALGVTLYRMVNGDSLLPAFNYPGGELEDAIVEGRFPDRKAYRPFVPLSLRKLVNKAMNPDPSKRFQSAAELRHRLEQTPLWCDWDLTSLPNSESWWAHVESRNFEYSVVSSKLGSKFTLQVTRKRPAGPERTIHSDCRDGLNRSGCQRATAKVLQRITSTGR